ncbi:MAG: multicopper oxidase domain-containing protein [Candidatus Acidiferrales bacterium]
MTEKFSNPIYIAILLVLAVAGSQWLSERDAKIQAAAVPFHRAEVVLTPKAELKTEPAEWSFAPEVPPAITRKEQRRVVVHWSIQESPAEVAPGVIYDDFWGFDGRVPGPMLRVREGDLVEVHLTNDLKSMHTHNIDFHFVMGPGGGAGALSVPPGQEAVLEARAMIPGFYMFHCATPDIPTHIANGMYGFVLVEPADGMPHADKELYVVQSEVYTNDDKPGHKSLAMDRAEKMDPQYVVFNGSVGSLLKTKAPHAEENQLVRIYVGNAGPNLISSFHLIGEIFDRVYREGDLISPPAQGLQTTLVPAGGSTVVEFTPRVPGTFLLVDHSIFRLHHGAVGSLVVDGAQQAEIFEPMTDRNKMEMTADSHLASVPSTPSESAAPTAAPAAEVPAKAPAGTMSSTHPTPMAHSVAPARAAAASPKPGAARSTANSLSARVKILLGSGILPRGQTSVKDFSPKVLTVKAGTTVIWYNTDVNMPHRIHGDNGEFNSPTMEPGDFYSTTFTKKGTIHYSCTPHPWMKGTVIVQ